MLLRTLAVPVLVLGLAVAGCGKKTPDGTTPPGETGAGGASAGGGDSGGGDAGGGESAGEAGGDAGGGDSDVSQKVCDAEVGDTPKAVFADNVILRLPKGMELVEENPFFARISTKDTVSTCDGVISFGALGYFQADATKTVKQVRDETIQAARGVPPNEVTWTEETEKGRDYSGSYSIPEDAKGNPPIKGWFVLKEKAGFTFWYALETHPNAWNALAKTFQESGNRLRIGPNIAPAPAPTPAPSGKKKGK
ncbi:hypothetical protein [Nannocystis bainbridge]|uniref:Lipoprotein n=1 Tax=Nannocystis bainbridge TaxID=2995303 RepID=A0ABT5E1R3_9BACT|nr:hypothetical protein [Nannocystis bainbridge]MDC0719819.1 hypothetical protein [Nannocystis bainbridge]